MFLMRTSGFNSYAVTVSVAILGGLFAAGTASAHHSFQMFDMQRSVTLEGRLTDFDLTNPHAYLTLEVTNELGEIDVWEIETVAGSALRRRGIEDITFAVGERLSIDAHPPRNAERRLAAGEVIRKSDGAEFVVSYGRGAPNLETPSSAVATSIEGVWSGPERDLLLLAPRTIQETWLLTEKGGEAFARYDGSQTPSVDCVPYAPPAAMLIPAPMSIEINESVVTIRTPDELANRTIYVDGRPHPENTEPSNQGHSIGRWEGDALIVDTVHFSEHLIGNGFGVPSSLEKHLIERFDLSEDGTKIDYSFTSEDSEFLAGRVTGDSQWTYSPDREVEIQTCDLETARRFLNAF